MQVFNCLIIDDEPLARKGLEDYCKTIHFLHLVALCKNALQANEYLKNTRIDLIFLDINMPILSGLDWLKTLDKTPLIIMTTAYTEYALESFSFDVIDYLVKPISSERFLQAVQKAYRLVEDTPKEEVVFVKDNQTIKKVLLKEILYIAAMQNYVKIITKKETIIAHDTLKNLKESLPNEDFIQTHKSYIVSKKEVLQIVNNQITIDEYIIPISVRMRKEVFGYFE